MNALFPPPAPPLSQAALFYFEGAAVRIFEKADGPWFVAADVCDVLDIRNSRDAMSRLDADEKDGVATTDAIGRVQEMTIINESGLYSLILTSRKESARRFKKWVTAEVLPSIRKTGAYAVQPGAAPASALEATITTCIEALEGAREEIRRLKQENIAQKDIIHRVRLAVGERQGRLPPQKLSEDDVLDFIKKSENGRTWREIQRKFRNATAEDLRKISALMIEAHGLVLVVTPSKRGGHPTKRFMPPVLQ